MVAYKLLLFKYFGSVVDIFMIIIICLFTNLFTVGECGNRPNFLLEVQLQYLLGYASILLEYPSILLGYPSNIHTFMPSIGSWCVIINFSIILVCINRSKSDFRSLQSLLLPQFSTYRHRTGFIVKRKQVRIPNYLGIPINSFYLFYF